MKVFIPLADVVTPWVPRCPTCLLPAPLDGCTSVECLRVSVAADKAIARADW